MADISSITLPNNGGTYNFKDKDGRNTQNLIRPTGLRGLNDVTLQTLVNTTRANRLAFLPADQIIIEKTTDGGTTWVDAGVTDAVKRGLFAETRNAVFIPMINNARSPLCGIRITITAMKYDVPANTLETQKYNYWNSEYVVRTERYCQLKEMYFWMSTVNDSVGVKVERATGGSPNNWSTIFNDTTYYMTGWSGCDYIRFPQSTFGGGTNQTGNHWNYRITLMSRGTHGGTDDFATTSTTSQQSVMEIRAYGDTWWTKSNEYMANDKMYTHDVDQNVTFPTKVTAASFSGTLTGNASTATKATQDESGNNIKASYASSLSISDHTITLKNKNDASLGTVTVPDTNTHRPIKVNSTQILGDNTTALNLAAGSNMSITSDANGNVTFAASGSAMPFMIVRQPVPVGISTDNTVVTFSIVLGGGTGSYTYQWQLMSGGTDWIDLGGSQESSIDILGHLVTDTIHRCVVSDGVTTLYSNPVYYYGINSGVTGVKQSVNDGNYGVCSTAAGTAAKTVSIPGLIVQPGVTIHVKFTNTNSASNPTLAVNSTPAKSIVLYGTTAIGTTAETTGWNAGAVVALTYDGTYWIRDQGYNTNTTYSNATTSSAGLMSAADKTAVNALKNLSTLEYEVVS